MTRRSKDAITYAGTALLLASALAGLLGRAGDGLAAWLSSSFGWATWCCVGWLAAESWWTVSQRSPGIVRVWWSLSLVGLPATLDLLGAPSGHVGSMVGGGLHRGFGLGAYVLLAIVLVAIARRAMGPAHAQQLSARVGSMARRFASEWTRAREIERQAAAARALSASTRAPAPSAAARPRVYAPQAVIDTHGETVRESVPASHPAPSKRPPLPTPRARIVDVRDYAPDNSVDNGPDIIESSVDSDEQDLPGIAAPNAAPVVYVLPDIRRLATPKERTKAGKQRALDAGRKKITRALYQHEIIGGQVSGGDVGPMLAYYEYEPPAGTKISTIKKLAPEIAQALDTLHVNVTQRGKVTLMEVPLDEEDRQTVMLRELMECDEWTALRRSAALPMPLGLAPDRTPVYLDLASAPHLLVAGTTGSGKSVGLNCWLTALLLTRKPSEMRILMIDPKRVELSRYAGIPHLLAPIAVQSADGIALLRWALEEMERRYTTMAAVGESEIAEYNARSNAPYHRVVIAIDEFASFISQAKEAELLISRIAAEGRAAGMHLILATQRPSVDVVTGIIKANFSTRITYKVSSGKDSETVMDIRGAEKLLGRGDSLCMLPGSTEWQRVHSAYISPDEVKAVCAAWRAQSGKQAVIETPTTTEPAAPAAPVQLSDDELHNRLLTYVRGQRWVSVSAVMCEMSIGQPRAKRALMQLEREGILGPMDPAQKNQRPVLNP